MRVKLTSEESSIAGFISWRRLAEELFHRGAEIRDNEKITHFEISERGINYFVASVEGSAQ